MVGQDYEPIRRARLERERREARADDIEDLLILVTVLILGVGILSGVAA